MSAPIHSQPLPPGRTPHRRPCRLLVLVAALAGLALALGPAAAGANTYTDRLAAQVSLADNGGGIGDAPSGTVWGQESWTAPSGMQYDGFAYTAASFSSGNSGNTGGGISAGFLADGGSAPATLMFPWTNDCSITNSGHEWASSGAAVGSGGVCDTSGNTSGWNYDNSERESMSPSTNPQSSYATLALEVFCQASSCPSGDAGAADVTNLSANVVDPDSAPSETLLYWASGGAGGRWYQTAANSPELAFNAIDPGGICYLAVDLSGPASYGSGSLVPAPSTVDVGGPVGTEFDSGAAAPCDGSENYGYTLPAGIASGIYSIAVQAANPGSYEAQGWTGYGSPVIGSAGNAIQVDNLTPLLTVNPSSSGTTGTLNVSAGPSGLASVSCTQAGSALTLTPAVGNPAGGAGAYAYTIPTNTAGLSCQATNNDANGALSGSISTPSVTFTDAGYTQGTWAGTDQTVVVSAVGTGATVQYCQLDGTTLSGSGTSSVVGAGSSVATVHVGDDGSHSLACLAKSSSTGVVGEATYNVDIDTQQPTLSFSGAAPDTWYSNQTPSTTATVIATASEPTTYSGIASITCTVNDGAPFTLSGVGNGTSSGSFVVTPNGQDSVACHATSGAGVSGPTATETIEVDNPNITGDASGLTAYGSSPLIDDGADPFSNGPSQTVWYRSAQSVTVTANESGGAAPIASIACLGAPTNGTGSWPNSGANTDDAGGERITVTVQPPGGDLVCTATDSAGNTYPLGSYEFQEDDTAPAGAFVAQASWPEPDQLELNVTDAGSGVAYVRVYAQLNSSGTAAQNLGLATSRGNGIWTVQVPDGALAPGEYTFSANVADNAGNSGQVTAGPDGRSEQLELPLRQRTTVTMQAASVNATEDAAAPNVLAAVLGAAPAGGHRAPSRAHSSGRAKGAPPVSALAAADVELATRAIDLAYGRTLTVHGELRNDRNGRPIAGARIDVYQEIASTSRISRIGRTTTNARGDYSYRVRGGASRLVFVAYPGTQKLRSAVAQIRERFAGRATLDASAVDAGGHLVLSGRVDGGHIPKGGVDVTIDYQQVGLPGRGTFGTVRTDASGVWHFVQPFSPATSGLSYRLWVTVRGGQPGWPYLRASSSKLVRRIG